MTRPMSEVLTAVFNRMELNGSAFVSLDAALTYGEITKIEHACANRIISRWSNGLDDSTLHNKTAKQISFKKLIKEARHNESMSVR